MQAQERTGEVTFKGQGVTLLGAEVKEGSQAPEFTAINNQLEPVSLSDLRGQVVIISAVPSVDTPVCEKQTRRFNEEASKLGAKVLTISMDLPFAQKRFCAANGIANVTLLSDYKDRQFSEAFGLRLKELGLIARAVYVIDRDGKVVYREICREVAEEPNYEKALEAAKKLA